VRRLVQYLPILCALLALSSPESFATRNISFEERVEAQRAIERVYFSHLDGARRTFEQTVTQELLERKVRTYLKQSLALDELWHTPITAEALRREAERIARDTKFPERLREIQTALNHDAVLLQETFVRASLADRLARSFFAFDKPIHEAARAEAEEIRARLLDGTIDPAAEHPRRIVEPAGHEMPVPADSSTDERFRSSVNATISPLQGFQTLGASPTEEIKPTPTITDTIGPVEENAGAFSIRVAGAEAEAGGIIYRVPKTTWDEWWAARQGTLNESDMTVVARASGIDMSARSLEDCPPDDTWDNGTLDDFPDARYKHAAVWTGTEMIIWGGSSTRVTFLANTGRYDPLTDTWRGVSIVGAPEMIHDATAVWTGHEMIVWGTDLTKPNAGGRYDPSSDSWQVLSGENQPTPRLGHSAIWTGTEVIIWGGFPIHGTGSPTSSGARYNPDTDTWRPLSTTGVPTPRSRHTAVWTGKEMVVWGGTEDTGSFVFTFLNTGGRYDPSTDTWSPTAIGNAPLPRVEHSSVWVGDFMVVWGGVINSGGGLLNATASGGRYDPLNDSWSSTALLEAPTQRRAHTAVWTGTRMIVWGGSRDGTRIAAQSSGGSYDPVSDRWQATITLNAPTPAAYHSAVWAGSLMIVWGGTRTGDVTSSAGGRYDPGSDSWTPTAKGPSGANQTSGGRAVWTGTEMIVWGGTAGRYDPLTGTWKGVSAADAPAERFGHAAVWTGDEMVIVGGDPFATFSKHLPSGRYDPIADVWRSVSDVDSPDVRSGATAVWTGREVIVWGGRTPTHSSDVALGVGGRYDPAANSWRSLPGRGSPHFDENAPAAVSGHSAIWTGIEMIIFGGRDQLPTQYGARYVPEFELWIPLPNMPDLQASAGHTAVWTGTQMIVLGGLGSSPIPPRAWYYDLPSDTWFYLPDPADPYLEAYRYNHGAVWTGDSMLVFGGGNGVVYDGKTRSWRYMSVENQPLQRQGPAVLWTGRFMLVWGGLNFFDPLLSGGLYRFGQHTDDDGDLISECDGDCDDADEEVWPGAPERCNGRDDSCEGIVDEDADGLDSDSDGTANACDACPQFANPGQIAPLACMAATEDGGTCLETGVIFAAPLDEGIVSVVRAMPATPDVIYFDFLSVTCGAATPIEVFLNEQPLTVFLFETNCEAGDALFHRLTVSDGERIREIWNIGGENVLRVRKAAFDLETFSGTVLGWVRAQVGSNALQGSETICIFDVSGRNCTHGVSEPGWFAFEAMDASRTVDARPMEEERLVSAPFTDTLPGTLDMSQVPDGPLRLCVGSSESPLLLAAVADGSLYVVDETTGATTSYGDLESGTMELAHDDLSRLTVSQTSSSDPRSLQRIRLVGLQTLDALSYIGPHLSGLEFIGRRLYGVEPTGLGARMMEIAADTGSARIVTTLTRDGSWEGLAYDERTGNSYTILHREDSQTLWSIEPGSGLMTEPVYLEFTPTALEVGPDGSLYATRNSGADTELYRLDPATGIATLVGPLGLRDVASLVTVRNHPRACIDIVKQGEQTLAINGSCNAPPSASAGADRTEECSSFAGATVSLDASESTDPDSSTGTNDDIVLFEWLENVGTPEEALLGTGESLQVPLALGLHNLALRITDSAGERSLDQIAIEVRDTQPPMIAASLISDNNRFATSRRSGHHGDDDDDGHRGDDDDSGNDGDDDDEGDHDGDDDDGGHHGDDDDDGGRFIAFFSAVDACDPNPSTVGSFMTGVCGAHPAANAQPVLFERDDTCEIETDDGVLQIEAPSLSLHVSASDGSGNQASVDVLPGESHTPLQTNRDRPGTTRNSTVDQTPTTISTPPSRNPVRRSGAGG